MVMLLNMLILADISKAALVIWKDVNARSGLEVIKYTLLKQFKQNKPTKLQTALAQYTSFSFSCIHQLCLKLLNLFLLFFLG